MVIFHSCVNVYQRVIFKNLDELRLLHIHFYFFPYKLDMIGTFHYYHYHYCIYIYILYYITSKLDIIGTFHHFQVLWLYMTVIDICCDWWYPNYHPTMNNWGQPPFSSEMLGINHIQLQVHYWTPTSAKSRKIRLVWVNCPTYHQYLANIWVAFHQSLQYDSTPSLQSLRF